MNEQNLNLHIKAFILEDKKRRLVLDQPAHSILGNFLGILAAQLSQAGLYATIKNLSNVAKNPYPHVWSYWSSQAAGAAIGLVVGTGTTAVALSNYNLELLISHGSAINQLVYNAGTFSVMTKASDFWRLVISRTYSNLSGGTINISEAGFYSMFFDGGSTDYCLIIRDVFTPVPVLDGKVFNIEYTISIPLL